MTRLDPDTWRRVSDLFDRAADLPAEERITFLDRACGNDGGLRARVESMLSASMRSGGLIDGSVDECAARIMGPLLETSMEGAKLPEEIPPFRILREIGRGGMGTVLLAERADGQFDQQVALKLLPSGIGGEEIRRRFVLERQILAGLEHPNIARLIDGGVTDDGQLYFAMEYVDGTPIHRYADEHRLGVGARLALFEDVCEAVEYAQRHLVVHRDLKPSNILVSDNGTVKLLDFGIAKVLDAAGDGAELTREGSRLMTPEYAAPEQILGEAVTTSTDVYSLGVVLYELLSGHRPHGSSGRAPGELERAILDGKTRWMPQAVGTTETVRRSDGTTETLTPQIVSAARGVGTATLRRQLRGDIAAIVAKALRREPQARYPTAEAFLEDLRRYRTGRPVSARRPSVAYRISRFVARHRIAVAAGAVVVAALVAGVAGTLWQARVASREAARANRVKDFLAGIFAEADPDATPGTEATASEILARGAERIEAELADEPETQAELLHIVGNIYTRLGDYERANGLLERSLAIRIRELGPEHLSVSESLGDLGAVAKWASNFATAESLFAEALAIRRRRLDDSDPRLATALVNLATAKSALGKSAEAEQLCREALAIDRRVYGNEHPEIADDLNNLADVMGDLGRADEELALNEEALAIRRRHFPAVHSSVALSLHNLGYNYYEAQNYEKAERYLTEALAMRRQLFGAEHPRLAATLRALAMTQRARGRLDEAQRNLDEALTMNRALLGDDHQEIASGLNELGVVAFQRGHYAAARERFRESLDRFRRILPPEHPTVLSLGNNLATLDLQSGEYESAFQILSEILAARREHLGENHPDVAMSLNAVGTSLRLLGDPAAALRHHRQALKIYRSRTDEANDDVAFTLSCEALAIGDQGRYDEAEARCREALAIYEERYSIEHQLAAGLQTQLGIVLTATGRYDEALGILRHAEAVLRRERGAEHWRTAEAAAALGACLLARGETEEARALLTEAHAALLASRGRRHPATRRAARDLSRLPQ